MPFASSMERPAHRKCHAGRPVPCLMLPWHYKARGGNRVLNNCIRRCKTTCCLCRFLLSGMSSRVVSCFAYLCPACAYVCACVSRLLGLSICLYVCLSVCLSVRSSAYPSVCFCLCMCLCLSVPVCVGAFVCLSVCLPSCLSACVCLSPFLFYAVVVIFACVDLSGRLVI